MSIIKIKQSDIEKIVSNIVNEQSLGDNPNSIAHEGTEISEDEMEKYLREIVAGSILMELQEKVIKLVSEATKMDAANIGLNTSFVDDLNIDSLDMVELMMKMEDEFGVEIPEDETENLKSIGDVVTYLKTKSH